MIHVVATVRVKTGMLDQFLELFKSSAPRQRRERMHPIYPGCGYRIGFAAADTGCKRCHDY